MATLYLLCGKVGTGKSTYAKNLQEEGKAIYFSADEWMLHFFGDSLPRAEFEQRLAQCKEMIYKVSERLLHHGCCVVLDFGFWKREERDAVRSRFNMYNVVLLYINPPEETIKSRINKRNLNLPEDAYKITEEMYVLFSSWFEAPTQDEGPILIQD